MMPIDPADRLPPLAEFLGELVAATDIDPEVSDDGAMAVSSIEVDLPFELDLLEENGVWQLDAAPPTQLVDTSVMPVWHRIHLTVSRDDGERSLDSLES